MTCPVCGAEDWRHHCTYTNHVRGRKHCTIGICTTCGCMFTIKEASADADDTDAR